MGATSVPGDAWEILSHATRYVIQKTSAGLTVGMHLDRRAYGEGHSAAGDLDQAVRDAYALALVSRERQNARHPGNGA